MRLPLAWKMALQRAAPIPVIQVSIAILPPGYGTEHSCGQGLEGLDSCEARGHLA